MISLKDNPKIVFAGSGPYAEPVFESLVGSFNNITLIVKKGTTKDTKIVQTAINNDIRVMEAENKESFHSLLLKIRPEIGIVVSFGIIISRESLELPKYGLINVHYSLLPKYRGASPIQAAILNGDTVSGVSFQKMAEEIDKGDILYQKEVSISQDDTTEILAKKMATTSAQKLPEVIRQYLGGEIRPQKQTGKPTYSKIIKKEDGRIDWNKSAENIERTVKAYAPWPSAYTFWNGKLLKILETDVLHEDSGKKPGTFIEPPDSGQDQNDKQFGIQTRKGILVIRKIQLEGKKPLGISDFLLGNSKIIGEVLG